MIAIGDKVYTCDGEVGIFQGLNERKEYVVLHESGEIKTWIEIIKK